MDNVQPPSCEICWAIVPRALMHFHRDWHEAQEGRGPRYFQRPGARTELDRLLEVIDTLRETPFVSISPKNVARLREQLMAEALELATDDPES